MNKFKVSFLRYVILVVSGLLSFAATIFIFANTYEVLSLQDVPSFGSVTQFEMPQVTEWYQKRTVIDEVRFTELFIPSLNNRISLSKAWDRGNDLLQLPSKGHYFFLTANPVHGNGDTIIYLTKSWRTVYTPERLQQGDIFRIIAVERTLSYKVVNVVTKKDWESHTIAADERPNLLLVILDVDPRDVYYINSVLIADEKNI